MRFGIPFVGEPATGAGAVSDSAIIEWLEYLYRAADQARLPQERVWAENIAFLEGRHWGAVREDVQNSRRLKLPQRPKLTRVSVPQVYVLARQAAAALVENLGTQFAVPATPDPDDVQAAKLATDVLQARYDADCEPDLRFMEVLWAMVAGLAARFGDWDPWAAGSTPIGEVVGAGDLSSRWLSPLQFHLCPWMDGPLSPIPWFIISDIRDVDEIADLYGGVKVEAEDYARAYNTYTGTLSGVLRGDAGGDRGTPRRKQAAVLKRLYVAPDRRHRAGLLFTWAGQKLLPPPGGGRRWAELPDGVMPLTLFTWFPVPTRIHPLPFISPMVDLNRQIDLMLSQLIEMKNKQMRGDMILRGDQHEGDVTQAVDPETGQKRIYVSANIQDMQLMQYDLRTTQAEVLLNRLRQEQMDAAGLHDPSLGRTAMRAGTATEMQMLKGSDLEGLTLFRAGFDRQYAKVGQHKLHVIQQHYDTMRLARVVGGNGAVRVRYFFGADLRDTRDVRTRSRPLMTEAMHNQLKQQAVAGGLYGPYAGPEDQYAKLTALLSLGLRDAEEDVEAILGETTMDDLQAVCSQLNQARAQAALVGAQAQLNQLVLGVEQQKMQAAALAQGQQQMQEESAGGGPAALTAPGSPTMGAVV